MAEVRSQSKPPLVECDSFWHERCGICMLSQLALAAHRLPRRTTNDGWLAG